MSATRDARNTSPLPGQIAEQTSPAPVGTSNVVVQVAPPPLRTTSKDSSRLSTARLTPIVPSDPQPPPDRSVAQPRSSLKEFAADLEALINDQHQELCRRLADFVRCQGSVFPDADASNSLLYSGPNDFTPVDSGTLVEELPRKKSSQRGFQCVDRVSTQAGADVMDEVLGTGSKLTVTFQRRATQALEERERTSNDSHAKLLRITGHWGYELGLACLILANALCTAWETDYYAKKARAGESPDAVHFDALMFLFCLLFTVDLLIRIWAQQMRFFYCLEWKWHWFDTLVVVCFLAEVVDYTMQSRRYWLSSTSVLRVVRLVRLARVARVGRALHSFSHFRIFRITIKMLVDAVPITIVFSIIIAMIGLVFAIFFTDGATAHIFSDGVDASLVAYFGSFFITMSTLQMAIFGGIDWEVALEPLWQMSQVYVFTFYFYVAFCSLAMLNVINAMFVENVLHRAKNDREFVVQSEMEDKREFLMTMQSLFEELDADGSGKITLPELQAHIMDPKVNAYFRTIDLNVFKVKEFFNLLDVNLSGDVDRSEFVRGCTRLRGDAKELDVAILQYEVKALMNEIKKIRKSLDKFGEKFDWKGCASPMDHLY